MDTKSMQSDHESALAFLKQYESRMAWDASSHALVVNGFVPPESTSPVGHALGELGSSGYLSTGSALHYRDVDVVYQLLHAGFQIAGQEKVPGVTADHIPMTRQTALDVLKPYEGKMHWDQKKDHFRIDGLPSSPAYVYREPVSTWPRELEACWTLMPYEDREDMSTHLHTTFVGDMLPKALHKAGFTFDGVEALTAVKDAQTLRKEAAVQKLKPYDHCMAWDDARRTFTLENPHHDEAGFGHWGNMIDACWSLVGAENVIDSNDEKISFTGNELPLILRDAGVRFQGSERLPSSLRLR